MGMIGQCVAALCHHPKTCVDHPVLLQVKIIQSDVDGLPPPKTCISKTNHLKVPVGLARKGWRIVDPDAFCNAVKEVLSGAHVVRTVQCARRTTVSSVRSGCG